MGPKDDRLLTVAVIGAVLSAMLGYLLVVMREDENPQIPPGPPDVITRLPKDAPGALVPPPPPPVTRKALTATEAARRAVPTPFTLGH